MATDAPRRRRSTQAERRAETQAALLDATIECLVTYGYAKTTTGRIAELAGVSRGAQLPYFPSRAAIVTAAVARLSEKRVAAATESFADRAVSLEECLDALWEAHQGAVFAAALELWVAARTDPDLRSALQAMERDVAAAILRTAGSALGARAERPSFTEDLVFALATIRGVALLQLNTGSRAHAQAWRQTRARLVKVLA